MSRMNATDKMKMSRREAMQLSTSALAGLSLAALKPDEVAAQGAPPQAPQATFHDGVEADAVVQALACAASSDRALAVEYEGES